MNLPNYLAPAPIELLVAELDRHKDLEVYTSPADMTVRVRCSCGEQASPRIDELRGDIVAHLSARLSDWGYEHRERALERVRFAAKWGDAKSPDQLVGGE